MDTEVIIVGAGPTGLSLACQFVRHGVDFVIVDEKSGITPFSKAIGVQARTLEIYEQINLADDLIKQGAIAEKVRLLEGGAIRGEIELKKIGQNFSPYPFLLLVEQSKHEHLLNNFLETHGKNVRWQTALADFSQDETGVTANIKNANGETEIVKAKYLVGCDGAKSLVRHNLGIEFAGSTLDRLFYVADVEIDWEFGHDALMICLAQNTLTAFFPLPGANRFRIVGTFPENHDRDAGEILYEEIERQIVADTKLKLDISAVNWFSVYRLHSRRVHDFSKGRCFLAGDAAHIHTPAGAQGMNTGIQDGYNLAWKIAQVLRGAADAKLLDTYSEERGENAKRLLETTDRAFEFGSSPEPVTAFLRTHVFPHLANFVLSFDAVKHFVFPLVSQIGISYRNNSLSAHGGDANFKIKAGDRMPYFLIDGASIYDYLRQPKFHLIVFSDGQHDLRALQSAFQNDFGDLAEFKIVSLFPQLAEIFDSTETFGVLLRPDNYIAAIFDGDSIEPAKNYLNHLASGANNFSESLFNKAS